MLEQSMLKSKVLARKPRDFNDRMVVVGKFVKVSRRCVL